MSVKKSDIDRKFRLIKTHIGELEKRIDKKIGFWIFKVHEESKEDLLRELESGSVFAATNKVYSDIDSWKQNDRLSASLIRYYNNDKRDEIDADFQEVEERISKRSETGLENLLNSFIHIKQGVLANLPRIVDTEKLPYFAKQIGKFFSGRMNDIKRLSAPNKNSDWD